MSHPDPAGADAHRSPERADAPSDPPSDAPSHLPSHLRPVDERPLHTGELPPLPTRDRRIPATAWIEAPARLRALGADLPGEPVAMYTRRIGEWFLWRAGPASGEEARYAAVHVDDLDRILEFRLLADGTGSGAAPDGTVIDRFRTWKEALLAASGRPVHRRSVS